MTRNTRLVAALALGAGLTAPGVALAQTQTGSTAPPPPWAQSAPAPALSTPPSVQDEAPTGKPWDTSASQRTYSVDRPPEGSSGIYLPAVILGYAKSAAGCVVIGCDDGPQVGGTPGTPSSGPTETPLTQPGSSGPP
jgi:hypothetical protein